MDLITIIAIINLKIEIEIWNQPVWKKSIMINRLENYQKIRVLIILIWMMSASVQYLVISIDQELTLQVNFNKVMTVPVAWSQNIKNIEIFMIP